MRIRNQGNNWSANHGTYSHAHGAPQREIDFVLEGLVWWCTFSKYVYRMEVIDIDESIVSVYDQYWMDISYYLHSW